MPMDVPSIVRHGWRQGSLFTLEASQALLGEKRTHANSRLILASQDCDIVHRGNGEPFVDTFEAKPILRWCQQNLERATRAIFISHSA
jgi:hypothetical protein